MRYVKYALLAILAIVLVTLAIANRGLVELRLLPTALTNLFGFQETVTLPLFLVILGSVALGLAIGFVAEWIREYHIRRAAERRRRDLLLLERENSRLRRDRFEGEDEVLALLDEPPARRSTGTAVART
jgi:uncharacterized integral membrane protein